MKDVCCALVASFAQVANSFLPFLRVLFEALLCTSAVHAAFSPFTLNFCLFDFDYLNLGNQY